MTSFYCSYFVKGRIFSPFFYCSDFENTVVDSVHLFFFAFPSSNFCVDQKPHKKVASINFLKGSSFVWGALEIKESFARKSHNGIYNTHMWSTCHVSFPDHLWTVKCRISLLRKRLWDMGPLGNAKVRVQLSSWNYISDAGSGNSVEPKQASFGFLFGGYFWEHKVLCWDDRVQ